MGDATSRVRPTPEQVALRLAVEARALEAAAVLEAAGARPILIKGASVAHRLYDDPLEREYADVDLLVDPARKGAAEAALATIGLRASEWRRTQDASGGRAWMDPRGGPPVDLHVRLPFVHARPGAAFDLLHARTEQLALLDGELTVLDPVALTLALCLHTVAEATGNEERYREELRRAFTTLDGRRRTELLDLARSVDVTDAVSAALSIAGCEAAARQLGLGPSRSFLVNLFALGLPPFGDFWLALDAERTARGRLRVIRERMLPHPGLARLQYGPGGDTPASTLLAYLAIPLRKLAGLPHGVSGFARAWLVTARARRSARAR